MKFKIEIGFDRLKYNPKPKDVEISAPLKASNIADTVIINTEVSVTRDLS